MIILGGSASRVLAWRLAKELDRKLRMVEVRKFPDGEKYVRVDADVKGENVVVVQSLCHTPDEFLFEYCLIVDTVKHMGAKKVIGVIPYLAYARMDARLTIEHKPDPGVALSPKTLARMVEAAGTDEVYTVDTHLHRLMDVGKVFSVKATNLTAMPLLADYVRRNFQLKDPIVIAPDEEAEQWAKIVAGRLGTTHDVFEKKRLGPRSVRIKARAAKMKGRDVVLVDDIISTGTTIVEATRAANKQGARRVLVACTHGILAENALARIYETGVETVTATDTIPSPVSLVSVAPLLADTLEKLR